MAKDASVMDVLAEANRLCYVKWSKKSRISHGHHGLQDVSIQLIDKVNAKDDLLAKEGQWAYRLRSLKPDGLNESDFFFSQNRGERSRK